MRWLRNLAIFVFVASLLMTGLGGSLDMIRTGQITRKHAWNDGLYLAIVAVFLLLLSRA